MWFTTIGKKHPKEMRGNVPIIDSIKYTLISSWENTSFAILEF